MLRLPYSAALLAASAALAIVAATTTTASAQTIPSKELYIGAFGGGVFPLSSWDIGENTSENVREPGNGYVLGLRGGYQLSTRLAIEAAVSRNGVTVDNDSSPVMNYNLSALYHFRSNVQWSPFVVGGLGMLQSSGDLGSDTDSALHVGLGLRHMLSNRVAVRVEARDIMTDGFDEVAHNLEVTIGVDIFALRKKSKAAAPSDSDNDGVANADDACPDVAGTPATNGCPDQDNDGVADKDDKCIDVSGAAATGGCPDSDGDGVIDSEDKCPEQKGVSASAGCPPAPAKKDRDNDGIADDVDTCPDTAGVAALNGCPDKDGDGVADAQDKCPDVKGTLAGCPDQDGDGVADAQDKCPAVKGTLAGCPDKDKDGVADKDDKCPDVTGLPAFAGCLPAAVKKFTGAIKGITFQTGKAKISRRSFWTLGRVVKLLKKYPGLRIRVEGHTDNRGKAETNLSLSQSRADSVKAHLVTKGIDGSRIETKGFGHTKPAKSNKTFAGRKANRRIEFTVLGR